MTDLTTAAFPIAAIDTFIDSVSDRDYVVLIGRSFAWNDDTDPPKPENSRRELEGSLWKNAIGAKIVKSSDVSHVLPRVLWDEGMELPRYSANNTTVGYVLTSDDDLLKVIDGGVVPTGTIEPVKSDSEPAAFRPFRTADGYTWKFMTDLNVNDKFVVTDGDGGWIPVKTLDVADDLSEQWRSQEDAVAGAIEFVRIDVAGSDYVQATGNLGDGSTVGRLVLDVDDTAVDDTYVDYSVRILGSTNNVNQVRRISTHSGGRVSLDEALPDLPRANTSYIIAPTMTIDGDGSDAHGFPVVADDGTLSHIEMRDRGGGYTHATATIDGNAGSGAKISIHLPPPGGHGSDPVFELNANTMMIVVDMVGRDDVNISTNNDFRQISLAIDPSYRNGIDRNTGNFDMTTRLVLSAGVDMENHWTETADHSPVTGSNTGATGTVVGFANTDSNWESGVLRLTDVEGRFANTDTVEIPGSGGADATVAEVYEPDILHNSGRVLFVKNREPIERRSTQTERIKLLFRF